MLQRIKEGQQRQRAARFLTGPVMNSRQSLLIPDRTRDESTSVSADHSIQNAKVFIQPFSRHSVVTALPAQALRRCY